MLTRMRVDLDVCLCGRRQGVLNSCDTVSCRKVSLFSLVICVSSRAIVSNSFISAALRRVNARNTARMISVTSAFSTAFTSVSWCEPRGSATRPLCPPYRRVRPTWHSPASLENLADWCRGSCFLRLLHGGRAALVIIR